MAVLAVLALALFAGVANSAPSENQRIVGGWPTTIERYPYLVQVDMLGIFSGAWSHSCGANILTTTHVLSAAHCFVGLFYRAENRRIRAGSTNRNTGGVIVYVEREYNHPTYNVVPRDADISVIKLLQALVYSPVIQPGAIVSSGTELPDGLPVYHAGWGAVRFQGAASPVLLETQIYTVNRELCAARYLSKSPPEIVTSNMICAGILDVGGRDACQGDSGGPLYYQDPVQGDILVGLVSWGEGCADPVYPGVSAAVSPYTNWIVQTTSTV